MPKNSSSKRNELIKKLRELNLNYKENNLNQGLGIVESIKTHLKLKFQKYLLNLGEKN
jgi:hypothetical protein